MFDWLNETTGPEISGEGGFSISTISDGVTGIGNSVVNLLQTTAIVCAVICVMIIGLMVGFKHSSEAFQEGKAWLFDIFIGILGIFATATLVTCVAAFCL